MMTVPNKFKSAAEVVWSSGFPRPSSPTRLTQMPPTTPFLTKKTVSLRNFQRRSTSNNHLQVFATAVLAYPAARILEGYEWTDWQLKQCLAVNIILQILASISGNLLGPGFGPVSIGKVYCHGWEMIPCPFVPVNPGISPLTLYFQFCRFACDNNKQHPINDDPPPIARRKWQTTNTTNHNDEHPHQSSLCLKISRSEFLCSPAACQFSYILDCARYWSFQ